MPKAPDRLMRAIYKNENAKEIVERLAEMDEREAQTGLELEEANSHWRAAA